MDEYLSSEGLSKKICELLENAWCGKLYASTTLQLAKLLFLNCLCTCGLYGGTKKQVTLRWTIQVSWCESIVHLSSMEKCSQYNEAHREGERFYVI